MGQIPYGSNPEYLPNFLKDARRESATSVDFLDFAGSRAIEEVSLNLFPPTNSSGIHWEATSYDRRLWWDDDNDWVRMATELLTEYSSPDDKMVIFWGNLVIPTVVLPVKLVIDNLLELLDLGPHLWFYLPVPKVLIECLLDGQVTISSTRRA